MPGLDHRFSRGRLRPPRARRDPHVLGRDPADCGRSGGAWWRFREPHVVGDPISPARRAWADGCQAPDRSPLPVPITTSGIERGTGIPSAPFQTAESPAPECRRAARPVPPAPATSPRRLTIGRLGWRSPRTCTTEFRSQRSGLRAVDLLDVSGEVRGRRDRGLCSAKSSSG
jgi:hypothetical protein